MNPIWFIVLITDISMFIYMFEYHCSSQIEQVAWRAYFSIGRASLAELFKIKLE